MNSDCSERITRYFWPSIIAVLLFLYFPLLTKGPLLFYDDLSILKPLFALRTWSDIIHYFCHPDSFIDLQPCRDLSFILDIEFSRLTNIGTYHAQNLCWWLGCCYGVDRLLLNLVPKLKPSHRLAIVCLFAIHPVYVGSIAWVAARKHLMALFFLICCIRIFLSLRNREAPPKKLLVALTLSYLLSVFSQPIYLLLPFWLVMYFLMERNRFPKISGYLILLCGLSIACSYLNIRHYKAFVGDTSEARKLAANNLFDINSPGDSLLAIGRYFYQICIPWQYGTFYSPGSWRNFLGLLILPLGIFGSIKVFGKQKTILWFGLFFVLLLIIVTKQRMFPFVSDTYLLGASLGFWILLGYGLERYSNRLAFQRNAALVCFGIVSIFFFWRSQVALENWKSDNLLWENSYHYEPTCFNAGNYQVALYQQNRISEAEPVEKFRLRNECHDDMMKALSLISLFYTRELAAEEKIQIVLKMKDSSINRSLVLSALYLQQGNSDSARQILDSVKNELPNFWQTLDSIELKPLGDTLSISCKTNPSFKYCSLLTNGRQR